MRTKARLFLHVMSLPCIDINSYHGLITYHGSLAYHGSLNELDALG